MKTKVSIYTDGSVYKERGGWAVRVLYGSGVFADQQGEIFGGEVSSQRAEMIAVIAGLHLLRTRCDVTIFTDSQAMISQWYRFLEAGKLPAYNELWMEIRKASKGHKVAWRYVRGHNGNPHNEDCDRRAKVMSHRAYDRIKRRTENEP